MVCFTLFFKTYYFFIWWMIVLILYIISNVDTFISSVTTDLKILICSYEHLVVGNICFAMKCSLYQYGCVGFWNKAFKKSRLFLIMFSCVRVCVFGYHIQSSRFSVCKINRSDILSSMLLYTYLTRINQYIHE